MKCPYNVQNKTEILQWQNDIDDNGVVTGCNQITKGTFSLMECLREECGAFYDGRCHYSE